MTDTNNNGISDVVEDEIEEQKASVRKMLATLSFQFGVLITLIIILIALLRPDVIDSIDKISEIIMAALMSCFTICGTYVGVSTFSYLKYAKKA